jgi:hypothetical protein
MLVDRAAARLASLSWWRLDYSPPTHVIFWKRALHRFRSKSTVVMDSWSFLNLDVAACSWSYLLPFSGGMALTANYFRY